MKSFAFAKRCAKEILRDPVNVAFGLGFPIILLLLLSAIQANVPVDLFEIKSLAPGISVFGLSFMTLFSSTLIAKDRESSFLQRLYTTPLKASDFIFGYMLPVIPLSLAQSIVCYLVAVPLGIPVTINIAYAVLAILPVAVFHVSLGLLCGSVLGVKQVGGICGALLTNLSAWLSGIWFELDLIGDRFADIAELLPFVHAVELERAVINGNFTAAASHFSVVTVWAVAVTATAIYTFVKRMNKQ